MKYRVKIEAVVTLYEEVEASSPDSARQKIGHLGGLGSDYLAKRLIADPLQRSLEVAWEVFPGVGIREDSPF
jgi:hypothetical protein